jgi:hypothetical protein
MSVRFYLVPIETVDRPEGGTYRLAKYFTVSRVPRASDLLSVRWQMVDFGFEPTALVAADVTTAQNTSLAAQSDVTVIPANIDNTLGANVATVQSKLEALNIPADNLVAGATYRQVLRGVIGIFLIAQRFSAMQNGRLFPPGITLSTTLGDLSQATRQKLIDAADQLRYDRSGLDLTSTLRQVLKQIANQQSPTTMLGVSV